MWRTIFVFNHKEELRPPSEFPPFAKHGELLLFKTDEFDNSRVPFRYTVTQVIFDVMSMHPTQYVHLQEVIDE
jgi:hypothetical protein